ncbi:MAG: sucrase ferredoxin [Dermatophilaceae bacterium]
MPPTSCSQLWDDEPLWGTAPPTSFWLALEQRGPWGALAWEQSRLDPDLGARVHDAAEAAGGRALLVRPVGRGGVGPSGTARRVFLAGGAQTGTPWLLSGMVADPARLLDLPWAALAAGDAPAARRALPELAPCEDPVLLVCTNGKRDVCCATHGRLVANQAAAQRPEALWECTHLSGHRYAATAVALPSGMVYGRLDGSLAVDAVDAAASGQIAQRAIASVEAASYHLRGLAHLPPMEQAADAYARGLSGEARVDALSTRRQRPAEPEPGHAAGADGTARCRVEVSFVASRGSRSHLPGTALGGSPQPVTFLEVTEHVHTDRPGSCGASPKPTATYAVRPVERR